jgi:type I restriction enzyme S subunit
MPYSYASSQDFLSLSKLKINGLFTVYILHKNIHNEIHKAQGTSIKGITKDELLMKKISIPSTPEQRRIGHLFSSLDHLLTLHQREYTKLLNIKKAMLEKMFPKEGEKVPEVRFKGFTGEWEEKKLGEVSLSLEYGLNAAACDYDGKNKYIRITDIDDETHELMLDALTTPDVDLENSKKYILQEGDILFARTGASVGKSYRYKASDGIVYFAGFLIRARIKPEYDSEFVFLNTLTDHYKKYIGITSQRSGQPGVNAQEYGEFITLMPSLPEQRLIGTFFSSLDHLLTLHQRELTKLQNIKKALLAKMFV